MSTSAIATRYARALLSLGAEKKLVEPFNDELSRVLAAFEAEDFLRLILESPTFPLEKKLALLADLTPALELSSEISQFLGLLLTKGRIEFLAAIAANYRILADELSGVVRARITAAVKPLKKQADAIQQALEQATGKAVALSVEEDSTLLGGIRAQIGGKVFDGSVRAQLKHMANTLQKG